MASERQKRRLARCLRIFASAALDSVFPRTCRVCGCSLTADERLLCLGCRIDMPRTGLHRIDFNTVHQRIGGSNPVDIAAGWFYYYSDSPYASLIREAKYGDRPATARELGRQYARELLADGFAPRFDVLLPVPLHRDKLLKRGYNQSEEIARGIGEILDVVVGDNLVALRGHSTQTRRSGYERYANVRDSFSTRNAAELDGLRVAIVDDIVTTGSTLLDCINAVSRTSSPTSISILTIGVTKMR